MNKFFSLETNNFIIFSLSHIVALFIIAFICLLIIFTRNFIKKSPRLKRAINYLIPLLILMLLVTKLIWQLYNDVFSLDNSLPLELCDITFILSGLLFLFHNRHLFAVVFFVGIAGALQALITPALYFDFPHYIFFFFFLEHVIVIITAFYFVFIEEYKPAFSSVLWATFYFNLIGIIVLIIDISFKSNYMFLLSKPDSASLFDLLGPWPFYIAICDLVAFFNFLLLYFPFFLASKIHSERNNN